MQTVLYDSVFEIFLIAAQCYGADYVRSFWFSFSSIYFLIEETRDVAGNFNFKGGTASRILLPFSLSTSFFAHNSFEVNSRYKYNISKGGRSSLALLSAYIPG